MSHYAKTHEYHLLIDRELMASWRRLLRAKHRSYRNRPRRRRHGRPRGR